MQSAFLLSAFPRSGLCWVSRFLTVPHRSICLCDGLSRATSAEDFWRMAEDLCTRSPGVEYFGNAEWLNLQLMEALLAFRPMTRVIWIKRKMEDSLRAAVAAGYRIDPRLWRGMGVYVERHIGLVDWFIPFEKLNDQATMEELWQKVLPTVGWNQRRWEAFAGKRIVCTPARIINTDSSRLARFLKAELEPIILPPV
jgi:hypothetical protein